MSTTMEAVFRVMDDTDGFIYIYSLVNNKSAKQYNNQSKLNKVKSTLSFGI